MEYKIHYFAYYCSGLIGATISGSGSLENLKVVIQEIANHYDRPIETLKICGGQDGDIECYFEVIS